MTMQLTSLECPTCGKQTLIQRKTDLPVGAIPPWLPRSCGGVPIWVGPGWGWSV